MRRPERNLPLGMIDGTALVGVLYVLVNLVYFRAMPLHKFGVSAGLAKRRRRRCLVRPRAGCWRGGAGVDLAAFHWRLSAPRDSGFRCRRTHRPSDGWRGFIQGTRTPTAGIVTLAVWSMLLVLSGSYEQLFDYSLFSSFIFHAITGLALFTPPTKTADGAAALPDG